MELAVYVPAGTDTFAIDPGSGIVGTVTDPGRVLVDYEGNRYGATTMVTYADRVHVAAGRHHDRYPTVARRLLEAGSLELVGWFDPETGQVSPDGPDGPAAARARIAAWCGLDDATVAEQLLTRGSARHLMRREISAALASGDPTQRFAARQMARRYGLDA